MLLQLDNGKELADSHKTEPLIIAVRQGFSHVVNLPPHQGLFQAWRKTNADAAGGARHFYLLPKLYGTDKRDIELVAFRSAALAEDFVSVLPPAERAKCSVRALSLD